MNQGGRLARTLAFVLDDGDVLYPVRKTNRTTWMKTFRVGLSSNAMDDIVEVHHESQLIELVLKRRCAVRCASRDGKRKMLLSPDNQSVSQVIFREEEHQGDAASSPGRFNGAGLPRSWNQVSHLSLA